MSIMNSLKHMISGFCERFRQRRILSLIAELGKPHEYDAFNVRFKIGPPTAEPLINALVKIGPPAAEPLIGALNDPAVRRGAIMALGEIRDKRAVEPLIALLHDKDVGKYAAHSLGLIGDHRAVKPLLELAWNEKDDPCDMNLPFIDALGEIGDYDALRTLEHWHELIQRHLASILEGESDVLVKQGTWETIAPCLEGLKKSIAGMRRRQGQI